MCLYVCDEKGLKAEITNRASIYDKYFKNKHG